MTYIILNIFNLVVYSTERGLKSRCTVLFFARIFWERIDGSSVCGARGAIICNPPDRVTEKRAGLRQINPANFSTRSLLFFLCQTSCLWEIDVVWREFALWSRDKLAPLQSMESLHGGKMGSKKTARDRCSLIPPMSRRWRPTHRKERGDERRLAYSPSWTPWSSIRLLTTYLTRLYSLCTSLITSMIDFLLAHFTNCHFTKSIMIFLLYMPHNSEIKKKHRWQKSFT